MVRSFRNLSKCLCLWPIYSWYPGNPEKDAKSLGTKGRGDYSLPCGFSKQPNSSARLICAPTF